MRGRQRDSKPDIAVLSDKVQGGDPDRDGD